MQPFLSAHATGRADTLVSQCLAQLGPIPSSATLGFLYVTDAVVPLLAGVLAELRAAAPQVEWVGATGIGVCAGGIECYDGPALSLLISDIPRDHYVLFHQSETDGNRLSPQMVQWCQAHPHGCALLHAVPTYGNAPVIIGALEQHGALFINGGLSSGREHYYHIADGLFEEGLSGVLFSAVQVVVTDHTQGCSPIGGRHRIDEAEQNLVVTLDGRPALQVLKAEIGEVLARDLRRLGGYIFVGLPVMHADSGDYLVRNLMGVDLEHGAIAVGDLMEGREELLFCRRDGNTAREDMVRMLERLKRRLAGRTIRGGIYISCLGRGRSQFGGDSEELRMIRDHLGDFPLAGFFANGEFYHGRLYGYTGVLTLFL